jgi:hypothetical protein
MEDIDRTYYKLKPAEFTDLWHKIKLQSKITKEKAVVIDALTFLPRVSSAYYSMIIDYGWTINNFNMAMDRYGT